jgi:zinc protease
MENVVMLVLSFAVIMLGILASSNAEALEPGQFDFHECVLDNGLRVITLEDFSCPIVTAEIFYHVGSKDENPERQGFAHMFEHMMFRGTDRLGPTSHFDYVRQAGGRCNGYTSFDQTVYFETLPADQLELALWLEAERMSFLKIDQDSFDTERKVVEEERRQDFNSPYGTLSEEAFAEIFKVHPYHWTPIGKIPHLRASTVPELRAFWEKYYVPNNATLIIVGAVKHEDAQDMAKRYFGWISKRPDPSKVNVREPMPEKPRDITLKQENAPAPLVGLVYRTAPMNHPDQVPLELLSTILGGGDSSRAFKRLVAGGKSRSKKPLAIGVRCFNYTLEQDGAFAVGAGMPLGVKDFNPVLDALKDEVEKVRSQKVRPRELEKAKNQMLREVVSDCMRVDNKARLLGEAAVLRGDVSSVNRRLDDIRKVTLTDLQRVAKQYLASSKSVTFRVESSFPDPKSETKNPEDVAPITGSPETNPPAPGRTGDARPEGYPKSAPVKPITPGFPNDAHETRTLKNGLKVVVVENHEVPFVTMMLGLRLGAWTESKPGCASMTLSMLTKGTKKQSREKLDDELETYAIQMEGAVGMDSSSVTATCVTDQLERAASIMGEVVLTPAFRERELDTLREQELTSLAVSANEPSYIAAKELRKHLYGQHPYSRMVQGEPDDVKSLTAEDLRKWWSEIARPDMACLYFSGDVTIDRAEQLAESAFGKWTANGPKPEFQVPTIPDLEQTRIYLVDMPGDQAQIRIGQRGVLCNAPGYFASRVVSGYFGESFGSRLNQSLRVKRGLTYGANGGYMTKHMVGDFVVSTFTKNETIGDAVRASIDEIKGLTSEPPSSDELDDAKAHIIGSFAGARETPQSIVNDLWFIEFEGLSTDHFHSYLREVQNMDASDCIQLTTSTIDPEKLVIVVVGAAEQLKPKLEEIAPVTVVSASLKTK